MMPADFTGTDVVVRNPGGALRTNPVPGDGPGRRRDDRDGDGDLPARLPGARDRHHRHQRQDDDQRALRRDAARMAAGDGGCRQHGRLRGRPLASITPETPVVLELSSWQLEGMDERRDRPAHRDDHEYLRGSSRHLRRLRRLRRNQAHYRSASRRRRLTRAECRRSGGRRRRQNIDGASHLVRGGRVAGNPGVRVLDATRSCRRSPGCEGRIAIPHNPALRGRAPAPECRRGGLRRPSCGGPRWTTSRRDLRIVHRRRRTGWSRARGRRRPVRKRHRRHRPGRSDCQLTRIRRPADPPDLRRRGQAARLRPLPGRSPRVRHRSAARRRRPPPSSLTHRGRPGGPIRARRSRAWRRRSSRRVAQQSGDVVLLSPGCAPVLACFGTSSTAVRSSATRSCPRAVGAGQ